MQNDGEKACFFWINSNFWIFFYFFASKFLESHNGRQTNCIDGENIIGTKRFRQNDGEQRR